MIHVRHNVDGVVDIDSFVIEQLGNVYTCDITLSIHCVLCGHIILQASVTLDNMLHTISAVLHSMP